jgi:hypothetical protein
MSEMQRIEDLLNVAITLLSDHGFVPAADALRDRLRGIRDAETAQAQRRGLIQLGELLEGIGSAQHAFRLQPMDPTSTPSDGIHGFRFRRTSAHLRAEWRYRRTLGSILEILASTRAA